MVENPPEPPTEHPSLSAATLKERLDAGDSVRLLDVRDRDEFEAWHIDGPTVSATQLPFAKFLQAKVTGDVEGLLDDIDGDGPITAVCARGEASAFVAGLLVEHGVDARNLADGMEGWARLYEAHRLPTDSVTVLQYERPASGCLSYLVVSGDEAAVVDPLRAFTDRYVEDAADHGATLRYAVDTHVHADHVSGVAHLAADHGVEPVVPARAVDRGVSFDVTELPADGSLSVGSTTLDAVPLPGHTTGMTGFRVGETLLAGDSVFLESVARPDLEAGDDGAPELARELYETLTERLAALPEDTLVAPGHRAETTEPAADGTYTARLGELRDRLPALALDRETFVERICGDIPPRPANFERIVAINLGTDAADDDTAFELELGPNNCAAAPL
ncbi:MBL fold metallo-hydrolase [Haloarcula onubensis]|uniref:MBL fold metallo-hydrolase n=1 Tax=Haloarcula onubensis TaxID=2950539 RepID=A0ABU2FJD7_9EURY|nr:MBL fold metallo-hydrolase [Halomicroarcula sp. S3CR25-11]MDS0280870.1 MBL fold metallo-hydrolase [Halomicroarcula sp. S3CR25-11]